MGNRSKVNTAATAEGGVVSRSLEKLRAARGWERIHWKYEYEPHWGDIDPECLARRRAAGLNPDPKTRADFFAWFDAGTAEIGEKKDSVGIAPTYEEEAAHLREMERLAGEANVPVDDENAWLGQMAQPELEDEQDRVDDLRADEVNEWEVADGQPLAEDEAAEWADWAEFEYWLACAAAGGEQAYWAELDDAYCRAVEDEQAEQYPPESVDDHGRQVLASDSWRPRQVVQLGWMLSASCAKWASDCIAETHEASLMGGVGERLVSEGVVDAVLAELAEAV